MQHFIESYPSTVDTETGEDTTPVTIAEAIAFLIEQNIY